MENHRHCEMCGCIIPYNTPLYLGKEFRGYICQKCKNKMYKSK